jgi:hypothetical protein
VEAPRRHDGIDPDTPGALPLEYFSPRDPQRVHVRKVTLWSILLLLSWGPFLCGVVNASTVSQSYVEEITASHFNGAILGFAIGIILALASLAGFVRMRHWTGTAAAGIVLLMQVSIATCAGVAS